MNFRNLHYVIIPHHLLKLKKNVALYWYISISTSSLTSNTLRLMICPKVWYRGWLIIVSREIILYAHTYLIINFSVPLCIAFFSIMCVYTHVCVCVHVCVCIYGCAGASKYRFMPLWRCVDIPVWIMPLCAHCYASVCTCI